MTVSGQQSAGVWIKLAALLQLLSAAVVFRRCSAANILAAKISWAIGGGELAAPLNTLMIRFDSRFDLSRDWISFCHLICKPKHQKYTKQMRFASIQCSTRSQAVASIADRTAKKL